MSFFNRLKKFPGWLKNSVRRLFPFFEKHRFARIAFLIAVIIPAIIVLVFVVVLPLFSDLNQAPIVQSATDIQNFIPTKHDRNAPVELGVLSQKKYALKIEESFLLSQLQMAKSDSIALCIDLTDSLLSLQIRGVNVRDCKIRRFHTSHAFKHLRGKGLIIDWLSSPFTLLNEWATIPKVPIKVKQAPKDTLEASKSKSEPYAELGKNDVFLSMKFNRNLFIRINQIETPSLRGRIWKCLYSLKLKLYVIEDRMLSLLHSRLPTNALWIEVNIPQNDAIAIYRALPRNTTLALRL